MKLNAVFSSLTLGTLLALTTASSANAASTWTGLSGTWSSTVSPGWTSGGVPNAIGAMAVDGAVGANSYSITQDILAGVTVGTINKAANGNHSWTITATNLITLNQDGASSGFATIENTDTNAGSSNNLIINGSLALADDLLITNSSSTAQSTSINLGAALSGSGNVTLSNSTNSVSVGAIRLAGANTFTGNITIQKGAVLLAVSNTAAGATANVITLGAVGQGDATLQTVGNNYNLANNIVVTGSTGGTNLLSSSVTSSSSIFAGTIMLNGNLTVESLTTGAGNRVRYLGIISGTGNLTKIGAGELRLEAANTYTGNTVVSSGTLSLMDNAQMKFKIGGSGTNNSITGTGVLNLDGDFVFDLSGAATTGSWNIVDVANLNETFSSLFSVVGFTDAGSNLWTEIIGTTTYTFSEQFGTLTATTAAPEPSTLALLAGGLVTAFGVFRSRSKTRLLG